MTNYFVRYLLLLLPTILISCKDGFDKELEREAKDFTTNRCPIEVESGTTLDTSETRSSSVSSICINLEQVP